MIDKGFVITTGVLLVGSGHDGLVRLATIFRFVFTLSNGLIPVSTEPFRHLNELVNSNFVHFKATLEVHRDGVSRNGVEIHD